MTETLSAPHLERIRSASLTRVTGRVAELSGLTIVARGLPVCVGRIAEIRPANARPVPAQVVGFRSDDTLLMPLTEPAGIAAGDPVASTVSLDSVPVGESLLGRVLNGLGQPIDSGRPPNVETYYPVYADPPAALKRRPIDAPLPTGIRAIDGCLTVGMGQRMGLFAGTGVGKSVLLGMIARNTRADVNVIALVGERGREVGDFIQKDLGPEGLARTVLVVSTSDESPVMRVRACFVAVAVAEFFRDRGRNVLLLMDSVTRAAMAQRQIGLAAGEPPATKGYPPSVFALLPKLLERAGRTADGSITGLYTVLVEGDDLADPIADATRGTLDGHVWLSRDLANAAHYPAISVLESVSRLVNDICPPEQLAAVRSLRQLSSTWEDIKDMVNIGAYAAGANPQFDLAIHAKPWIDAFLTQEIHEKSTLAQTRDRLTELIRRIDHKRAELNVRSNGENGDGTLVAGAGVSGQTATERA